MKFCLIRQNSCSIFRVSAGPTNAMSGPKWVRSSGATALLLVCGGWGWLGYRGQTGPSKPSQPASGGGLESGLHKKPWRT